MKQVNLKDLYFYIKEDILIEVDDDVYHVFELSRKKEAAYYAKLRYHKAFYSLDRDDGIEKAALLKVKSPKELFDIKQTEHEILERVESLPKKQSQRIFMFFYLDMSVSEIAECEKVSISSVSQSIMSGLKNLKKYF